MADISHQRRHVSPTLFLQADSQQFRSFEHLPGDQFFFTRCHCASFFRWLIVLLIHTHAVDDLQINEILQRLPSTGIDERFGNTADRSQRSLVFAGEKNHVLDVSSIASHEFRSNKILDGWAVNHEPANFFDKHWLESAHLCRTWFHELYIRLVGVERRFRIERQSGRFDCPPQFEQIVVTGRFPDVKISGSAGCHAAEDARHRADQTEAYWRARSIEASRDIFESGQPLLAIKTGRHEVTAYVEG
ncbi:MAG: hypothetical protein EBZ74_12370 [Planctomycetia bacterium]|nr:hypothetical protein [Planctomycetia bacterium]